MLFHGGAGPVDIIFFLWTTEKQVWSSSFYAWGKWELQQKKKKKKKCLHPQCQNWVSILSTQPSLISVRVLTVFDNDAAQEKTWVIIEYKAIKAIF